MCAQCIQRRRNVRRYFYDGVFLARHGLRWDDIEMGLYEIDKALEESGDGGDNVCNKFYERMGGSTGGLGLIFCIWCKRLVGYQVLKFTESSRTLFDLILTRWDRPPDIIIYDNACNMHKFCLSREPEYFKDVMFILDRLHVAGHVKCCLSYDPYQHAFVVDINTQLCEQANAPYKDRYASLHQMKQGTFLFHLRHFIAMDELIRHGYSM